MMYVLHCDLIYISYIPVCVSVCVCMYVKLKKFLHTIVFSTVYVILYFLAYSFLNACSRLSRLLL